MSLGVSDLFLLYHLPAKYGLAGLHLSLACLTSICRIGCPRWQLERPGVSRPVPATSAFGVIGSLN